MASRSDIDAKMSFGYNFNEFRHEIYLPQSITVHFTGDLVKYVK